MLVQLGRHYDDQPGIGRKNNCASGESVSVAWVGGLGYEVKGEGEGVGEGEGQGLGLRAPCVPTAAPANVQASHHAESRTTSAWRRAVARRHLQAGEERAAKGA